MKRSTVNFPFPSHSDGTFERYTRYDRNIDTLHVNRLLPLENTILLLAESFSPLPLNSSSLFSFVQNCPAHDKAIVPQPSAEKPSRTTFLLHRSSRKISSLNMHTSKEEESPSKARLGGEQEEDEDSCCKEQVPPRQTESPFLPQPLNMNQLRHLTKNRATVPQRRLPSTLRIARVSLETVETSGQ